MATWLAPPNPQNCGNCEKREMAKYEINPRETDTIISSFSGSTLLWDPRWPAGWETLYNMYLVAFNHFTLYTWLPRSRRPETSSLCGAAAVWAVWGPCVPGEIHRQKQGNSREQTQNRGRLKASKTGCFYKFNCCLGIRNVWDTSDE